MCLLYMYLLEQGGDGHYQLILANNRDEFWERDTAPAGFWGDKPRWLGGMDLGNPSRGTWLGISETGKLGCLLNILAPQKDDALSRVVRRNSLISYSNSIAGAWPLVRDFLTGTTSASDYREQVAQNHHVYNAFNLILLDLSERNRELKCISCQSGQQPVLQQMTRGFYSCDNGKSHSRPWTKRAKGQQMFSEIVEKYNTPEQKDLLINEIIDMLNSTTRHWPDDELKKSFADVGAETTGEIIEERSSQFVFSPSVKYGTRTNTIILVDKDNKCEYIERTMITPVNAENPQWSTSRFAFNLDIHA